MALIPRVAFNLLSRHVRNSCYVTSFKFSSAAATPTESADEFVDEEKLMAAAELEAKRNKSRLKPQHYKVMHGELPVDPTNPSSEYQQTVRYQRKLLARYGSASGINLGISWPTRQELEGIKEYEQIAHPFTLQEMVESKRKQRKLEEDRLAKRKRDIEMKVSKLDGWMKELQARNEKKLTAAREAQEKKDKLIEEVRQHFGYVVSMKDPRFQEMLQQKEKEAKKTEKEAKKKIRMEKAVAKASVATEPPTATEQPAK